MSAKYFRRKKNKALKKAIMLLLLVVSVLVLRSVDTVNDTIRGKIVKEGYNLDVKF